MKTTQWISAGLFILLLGAGWMGFRSVHQMNEQNTALSAAEDFHWALQGYLADHDQLPLRNWTASLRPFSPSEMTLSYQKSGEWRGFAALPGWYGQPVKTIAPDRVLFVSYASQRRKDEVRAISEIGSWPSRDEVMLVTLAGTEAVPRDVAIYRLGRQGVLLSATVSQ